jgi:hypothetical protein
MIPARIVGQFSSGIIDWIEAQQLRPQDAEFRMGESAELKTGDDQYGRQILDARFTELAFGRSAGARMMSSTTRPRTTAPA